MSAEAAALPRQPPLPPERPQTLREDQDGVREPGPSARREAPKAAPASSAGAQPESAEPPVLSSVSTTCRDFLASGQVEARRVSSPRGAPGCGIDEPVTLSAIKLADGRRVAVTDAGVMRCEMARAFSAWVIGDFATVLETNGRRLDGIVAGAAYECRGRNRVNGAKLSEHGKGNALDLRGMRFVGGTAIRVGDKSSPVPAALFESACRHFTTVLGPGSDGYHEDHLHIDLAPRRPGSHYCRWRNREVAR